jgi:2-enoate reductase
MLIPGSTPRIKYDVANYREYLEGKVRRDSEQYGLAVRFGVKATADLLRDGGYEAVVLCTGGRPLSPTVDGIDLPHVVQAIDLLTDPNLAHDAAHIVIIGGGDVGCETAHFLAREKGKRVTVVELLPHLMQGSCTANRGYLLHHLEAAGVVLWNCSRLARVEEGGVIVVRNVSSTVPSPYTTWKPVLPENVVNPLARRIRVKEREVAVRADLVVLAVGLKPDDRLYQACIRQLVAPEIHNIGDSFRPATVSEATTAGFAVARTL